VRPTTLHDQVWGCKPVRLTFRTYRNDIRVLLPSTTSYLRYRCCDLRWMDGERVSALRPYSLNRLMAWCSHPTLPCGLVFKVWLPLDANWEPGECRRSQQGSLDLRECPVSISCSTPLICRPQMLWDYLSTMPNPSGHHAQFLSEFWFPAGWPLRGKS
jgi:hypothetical protein